VRILVLHVLTTRVPYPLFAVGSHTVVLLVEAGYNVTVVDNLANSKCVESCVQLF
jgi:hypothetical protein